MHVNRFKWKIDHGLNGLVEFGVTRRGPSTKVVPARTTEFPPLILARASRLTWNSGIFTMELKVYIVLNH